MKNLIYRILFFILIFILIFSCAISKTNYTSENYTYLLIKTEKLINHKLLSFASKYDTILIVSKNNISEDCIKKNLVKISLQSNNRIYKLNDSGEEIIFTYYTKGGENNHLKILTSSEKPGSLKKQIFSYNSPPYFVKNCSE